MMTHAYQEIYLSKAQARLGEAFDYAINDCSIKGNEFTQLFAASSIATRMGKGEPSLVAGKSGIELAREIIFETRGDEITIEPQDHFSRSCEYWIGWAVAYYQWHSNKRYSDIFEIVNYEELCHMYIALHEADISKFVSIMDSLVAERKRETNLKRIRSYYGITQASLAKYSGVSLRSIQMYEQRNKDINKASVDTVHSLAKTLGCDIEDLME